MSWRGRLQRAREALGLALLGAAVRVLGIAPDKQEPMPTREEQEPMSFDGRAVVATPKAQEMLAAGRRQPTRREEPEPPLEGSIEAQRAGEQRLG